MICEGVEVIMAASEASIEVYRKLADGEGRWY